VVGDILAAMYPDKIGGIEAIEKVNNAKAELLYNEIDRNPLFKGVAEKEDRSAMNATFVLTDVTLEEKFNIYKKQKKFTYNSFEDLYNWIKKNALIIIEAQKILFDESSKTKEEKIDDIADELEKNGIKQFFAEYKASRVEEKVDESEIRQAIKNTIELIKKE
jgi:hypothetical protein